MNDNNIRRFNHADVVQTAQQVMAYHQQGELKSLPAPTLEFYFENLSGELYSLLVDAVPAPENFHTPTLPKAEQLREDRLYDALEKGINATHHYHMRPRGARSLVIHVQKFTDHLGKLWVLDIRIKDRQHNRPHMIAAQGRR